MGDGGASGVGVAKPYNYGTAGYFFFFSDSGGEREKFLTGRIAYIAYFFPVLIGDNKVVFFGSLIRIVVEGSSPIPPFFDYWSVVIFFKLWATKGAKTLFDEFSHFVFLGGVAGVA